MSYMDCETCDGSSATCPVCHPVVAPWYVAEGIDRSCAGKALLREAAAGLPPGDSLADTFRAWERQATSLEHAERLLIRQEWSELVRLPRRTLAKFMRRIYIAGSSNERGRIAQYMAAVRACGYEVTYDWVALAPWDRVAALTPSEKAEQAMFDLDAVRAASVVWYVTPDEESGKSEGSHAELSAGIVLGKVVLVSGHLNPSRIFPHLATRTFAMHAEALESLRTRAWMDYGRVE